MYTTEPTQWTVIIGKDAKGKYINKKGGMTAINIKHDHYLFYIDGEKSPLELTPEEVQQILDMLKTDNNIWHVKASGIIKCLKKLGKIK